MEQSEPPPESLVRRMQQYQKECLEEHQNSPSSTSSNSSTSSTSSNFPDHLKSQQFYTHTSHLSSMQTTQIKDLQGLRLGIPYLYCHSGGCEHLITFVDMRLLPPKNTVSSTTSTSITSTSTSTPTTQGPSHWPRELYRRTVSHKRCTLCLPVNSVPIRHDIVYAKFVVYDHPLLDRSPSFLCEECYDLFNYDEQGELKVKEFQVFPYYHELWINITILMKIHSGSRWQMTDWSGVLVEVTSKTMWYLRTFVHVCEASWCMYLIIIIYIYIYVCIYVCTNHDGIRWYTHMIVPS